MGMPTIDQLMVLCQVARFVFPSAIIAGGAPRDVLSGVPVKDIDVFVELNADQLGEPESEFVLACRIFALAIGGEAEMRPSNGDYARFLDLCDITKDGVKGAVQVIGLTCNPIDDVPKYDFDLSQVFVTPTGLFMTQAASMARTLRVITFTPSAADAATMLRSKARLERLRAKYQGWQFANTEALDALVTAQPLEPVAAS